MDYPWYTLVGPSEGLQQGDILGNAPLYREDEGTEGVTEVLYQDVVILTQACDLVNGKSEVAMVCPLYPLDDVDYFRRSDRRDGLRKNMLVRWHVLQRCDLQDHEFGFMIADFGGAFGVPVATLVDIAAKTMRVRLLPPYREHLAQRFGMYFMRVALPTGIESLPSYNKKLV